MAGRKRDHASAIRKSLEKAVACAIKDAKEFYRSHFMQEMPPVSVSYEHWDTGGEAAVFRNPNGETILILEREPNFRLGCHYMLWGVCGFRRIFSDDKSVAGKSLACLCYIADRFPYLKNIMEQIGGYWHLLLYIERSKLYFDFAVNKYYQQNQLEIKFTAEFIFDESGLESFFAVDGEIRTKPVSSFSYMFPFNNDEELQDVANRIHLLLASLRL